ncbi:galactose-specific lectin nattectin-like [Poeciliopsis prolifica]|uniref:galactose-specific lectin nattectin-like n=1 Tax=Poeciliopsis prolifica TaxID=188132 RepID=UPI0024143414|nr:galactose-specific lectin nattectin-like [Poeciliopsis prolifica]XP_054878097.1 galactose-specific lectin nattectin-like [Poeciliopsis prolifica]
MAAGLLFSLLLGLSFGLWDGADAGCQLKVADCDKCTQGWSWLEGRCFLHVNIEMTWGDAEKFCLTMDSHLTSINTLHEYHFIRELAFNATGTHRQTWVGGHDSAQDGIWFWSDGSKFVFHHWAMRSQTILVETKNAWTSTYLDEIKLMIMNVLRSFASSVPDRCNLLMPNNLNLDVKLR